MRLSLIGAAAVTAAAALALSGCGSSGGGSGGSAKSGSSGGATLKLVVADYGTLQELTQAGGYVPPTDVPKGQPNQAFSLGS